MRSHHLRRQMEAHEKNEPKTQDDAKEEAKPSAPVRAQKAEHKSDRAEKTEKTAKVKNNVRKLRTERMMSKAELARREAETGVEVAHDPSRFSVWVAPLASTASVPLSTSGTAAGAGFFGLA